MNCWSRKEPKRIIRSSILLGRCDGSGTIVGWSFSVFAGIRQLPRHRCFDSCSAILRNRLNNPGEGELRRKSLNYCADCDAGFYHDQPRVVVGKEGNTVSGALALLLHTPEVDLVYRDLAMDECLQDHVEQGPIHEHPGTWVQSIEGDTMAPEEVLDPQSGLRRRGSL